MQRWKRGQIYHVQNYICSVFELSDVVFRLAPPKRCACCWEFVLWLTFVLICKLLQDILNNTNIALDDEFKWAFIVQLCRVSLNKVWQFYHLQENKLCSPYHSLLYPGWLTNPICTNEGQGSWTTPLLPAVTTNPMISRNSTFILFYYSADLPAQSLMLWDDRHYGLPLDLLPSILHSIMWVEELWVLVAYWWHSASSRLRRSRDDTILN